MADPRPASTAPKQYVRFDVLQRVQHALLLLSFTTLAVTGLVQKFATAGASEWFVNYYADIGGGSSAFTWQGAAGIGYAFKWGDIVFDYRYLYYSQSDDDKLIDNISFGGFALGANFRF